MLNHDLESFFLIRFHEKWCRTKLRAIGQTEIDLMKKKTIFWKLFNF